MLPIVGGDSTRLAHAVLPFSKTFLLTTFLLLGNVFFVVAFAVVAYCYPPVSSSSVMVCTLPFPSCRSL